MNQPEIKLIVGDITKHPADIIVNSANKTLMAGSGVCGAIHKAAGPELEKECVRIKKEKNIEFLQVGGLIVSSAHSLPHKYVIHTVSPRTGKEDVELLANCYINSLNEAEKLNAKSISFPAIGTGIYGIPLEKSAEIVKKVLAEVKFNNLKEIFLFFKNESEAQMYSEIFKNEN